jgi:hypothetical protein
MLWLFLVVADIAVAQENSQCGERSQLLRAVEQYCRSEAAPSERLGCRVASYAFSHCDSMPSLESSDDGGALHGAIRDPRGASYAWLLRFAPDGGRRWKLTNFKYDFDDCDAMGIPPPPRGPLRLTDLRRR